MGDDYARDVFEALFSPLDVGRITLKNRILSSGHDTVMSVDGFVSDQLIEYQRARAAGGVGHIVLQVSSVHHTSDYTAQELIAVSDDAIPGYRRIADAVHAHDCHLFAQVFHGGREIMSTADGMLPIAWAPSSVPNERFHVMPKPLTRDLIDEIVDGFGASARRMAEAGIDGVEIVASHGYLPAQFLNPRTNLRDDGYGGSLENRLRFTQEVITSIRAQAGDDAAVWLYGSRTHDDRRGGDVDLLIRASHEIDLKQQAELHTRLERELLLPVDISFIDSRQGMTRFQKLAAAQALPVEAAQ